jgi:uncharacterized protein
MVTVTAQITPAFTASPSFSPSATLMPVVLLTPTPSLTTAPSPTPSSSPTPFCAAMPTQPPENSPAKAANDQLILAAERGDTLEVLRLLRACADINARDGRGRTPVMAATHANRIDTVQALIQAGADIQLQDNLKDNPFLYAGAEGLLEILRLTIDAGANTRITNRFGGTALIPAAEHAHVEVIRELLTRTDVDVNHVNNLGWTALLEAIILGNGDQRHVQTVQLLVTAGANVNLPDGNGVTPLAHARRRGFQAIVDILQKAGAR